MCRPSDQDLVAFIGCCPLKAVTSHISFFVYHQKWNLAKVLTKNILYKSVAIYSTGKDRYGRTLGYIFIEDQAINTMMVRMGMAWWYRRYDKTEELENAERYAKENKIGLWADPNPIAPWDWRKGKR